MSQTSAILLMMNNYLHDVATAMLFGSGFAMWVMYRVAAKDRESCAEAIGSMFNSMSKLALFSLVWIIVGGVPRTIFYMEFEWSAAAGRGQVQALIIKHILAFLLVGWGVCLWLRLKKHCGEVANAE